MYLPGPHRSVILNNLHSHVNAPDVMASGPIVVPDVIARRTRLPASDVLFTFHLRNRVLFLRCLSKMLGRE